MYLYKWIAYFDDPKYVTGDRGSNLNAKYVSDMIQIHDYQLRPFLTQAPWSIGSNKRSHRFLHKAMDKLLSTEGFELGN